ncbi:MAG: phosphoadenosine phosphosulfate reductase family protein, partial [Coriobacteriales bacterium]
MSTELFDPVKTMSRMTNEVIVGFSGGKDSIVALDLCMRYFDIVHPYFLYLVPGLEFQERMLRWYERRYGVEIIRLPHFEVSNFLRYGTFRESDFSVPIVSVSDMYSYLRGVTGATWIAAGERIADSIVRRAMIKSTGSIDTKRGRFYPVAYWRKAEIMNYIKRKRLYLPPDSRKFGFSFRSLDGRQLAFVKDRYP